MFADEFRFIAVGCAVAILFIWCATVQHIANVGVGVVGAEEAWFDALIYILGDLVEYSNAL
jgi:hypothetical protein